MNKNVAEKLHSGDEVKIKKTGEIKTVIETDVTNKSVVVTCEMVRNIIIRIYFNNKNTLKILF